MFGQIKVSREDYIKRLLHNTGAKDETQIVEKAISIENCKDANELLLKAKADVERFNCSLHVGFENVVKANTIRVLIEFIEKYMANQKSESDNTNTIICK